MRLYELLNRRPIHERLNSNEVHFAIDLGFDEDLKRPFYTGMRDKLRSLIQGFRPEVELDDQHIVVRFNNLQEAQASHSKLEQVVETVEAIVNRELKTFNLGRSQHLQCEDVSTYLNVIGFPLFKLEWKDIYIQMKPQESLSGIDKMIGRCENLTFHDCWAVSGGLLSLLKLPKTTKVTLYAGDAGSTMKPNWLPILYKHLEGDRDILDCKEELMEAGMKDYAKL